MFSLPLLRKEGPGVVDNPAARVYLVASLEIILKIIFRIIPD